MCETDFFIGALKKILRVLKLPQVLINCAGKYGDKGIGSRYSK